MVCRKKKIFEIRFLLLVTIQTCLMGQKWALVETESETSISQMYGYNADQEGLFLEGEGIQSHFTCSTSPKSK